MTLFAILAILLVIASYVFVIFLAAACVYLPFLLLINTSKTQAVLLQLFGIAIAGGLLRSSVPRADKFEPPGPQLIRAEHPRLFAELDAIAASLEVYLIGEVNAWVADRGSDGIRQPARDGCRSAAALGADGCAVPRGAGA
jgi:hypothetical protein